MLYTTKALDYFYNPRNVGEMEDADATAQQGEPVCGDTVRVWIKVKDDVLEKVTFKAFGCPAVISCCSMMTEMAIGKTLDEASKITDEDVVAQLGGMPQDKLHCSLFAAEVLRETIDAYKKNVAGSA